MGESHDATHNATMLLGKLADGDEAAARDLLPLVYEELRALAGSHFRNQPKDHTLQPTALVHEAFIRLIDQTGAQWNGRAHFFAVAALAMRQILTDAARRRGAQKRGGGAAKIGLDKVDPAAPDDEVDIIALDEALRKLSELDQRKGRVVELRFFGGLSVEEVAAAIGVSKTTVESEWRAARAWLSRELSDGTRGPA